ncbi:MAG: hypothetical protein U5M50_03715 [Sphingobium sp.]|nr:hypothetical protein [Sphingobium sp.]
MGTPQRAKMLNATRLILGKAMEMRRNGKNAVRTQPEICRTRRRAGEGRNQQGLEPSMAFQWSRNRSLLLFDDNLRDDILLRACVGTAHARDCAGQRSHHGRKDQQQFQKRVRSVERPAHRDCAAIRPTKSVGSPQVPEQVRNDQGIRHTTRLEYVPPTGLPYRSRPGEKRARRISA